MKKLKKIQREYIWLGLIALGPIIAYLAVFNPAISLLGVIFIFIGLKGILLEIM